MNFDLVLPEKFGLPKFLKYLIKHFFNFNENGPNRIDISEGHVSSVLTYVMTMDVRLFAHQGSSVEFRRATISSHKLVSAWPILKVTTMTTEIAEYALQLCVQDT